MAYLFIPSIAAVLIAGFMEGAEQSQAWVESVIERIQCGLPNQSLWSRLISFFVRVYGI